MVLTYAASPLPVGFIDFSGGRWKKNAEQNGTAILREGEKLDDRFGAISERGEKNFSKSVYFKRDQNKFPSYNSECVFEFSNTSIPPDFPITPISKFIFSNQKIRHTLYNNRNILISCRHRKRKNLFLPLHSAHTLEVDYSCSPVTRLPPTGSSPHSKRFIYRLRTRGDSARTLWRIARASMALEVTRAVFDPVGSPIDDAPAMMEREGEEVFS